MKRKPIIYNNDQLFGGVKEYFLEQEPPESFDYFLFHVVFNITACLVKNGTWEDICIKLAGVDSCNAGPSLDLWDSLFTYANMTIMVDRYWNENLNVLKTIARATHLFCGRDEEEVEQELKEMAKSCPDDQAVLNKKITKKEAVEIFWDTKATWKCAEQIDDDEP